jgi:crotonobetainyl-CoA:carnitine CoA-transferase CaiB-like acyl-CoA transferase
VAATFQGGSHTFSTVNDFADPVNNPQVIANEHMVELDDPAHGKVPLLGIPVKLTNPSRCRRRIASCKP